MPPLRSRLVSDEERMSALTVQIEPETREFIKRFKRDNDLHSLGEATRQLITLGRNALATNA